MKENTEIIYKKDGEVASIVLNRPEVLNALNQPLMRQLSDALQDAESDPGIRVVVISGAGRAFCAGQDLREREFEDVEAMHKIGAPPVDPFERIETMTKPVVAAVHGYAVTGGFFLAGCCDIVVATEDAKFADTHARWGILPSGSVTQRWSRKVGLMRAKYLMLTSEFISAHDAERMGLVSKVVPFGRLDAAVKSITSSLLKNNAYTIAHIKTMLNRGYETDFATAVRMEVLASKWGGAGRGLIQDRTRRIEEFKEKKSKSTDSL
ncbi:MAG: enoyl-CoA hydratase/isomerase family protein [Dehalococcoidia bacterium]|nr:enoyl-CoA hydratase/isomerase family protein [Dehalococcoidia bacterium]